MLDQAAIAASHAHLAIFGCQTLYLTENAEYDVNIRFELNQNEQGQSRHGAIKLATGIRLAHTEPYFVLRTGHQNLRASLVRLLC